MDSSLVEHCIRHRGHSDQMRENTIHGISTALMEGYKWVEVDVRACRDELVLCHDSNLLRTTGVDRELSSCFYSEISHLVPRLVTALSVGGMGFNLEIKEKGLMDWILEDISGFTTPIIFTSFEPEMLESETRHNYKIGRLYQDGDKVDYSFGDLIVVEDIMLPYLDWKEIKTPVWCYTVPAVTNRVRQCLLNGADKVIVDVFTPKCSCIL